MELRNIIRNIDAEVYLETFLIAAVVSILAIRVFLYITGFPQIGSGDFHIAHMLWGGFFMTIAIIILLSFLNKGAMQIAAILAGVGFGTFIDELGKFITSDNDYFFQPTIALIYVIFVLFYFLFRFITRYQKFTSKEYLINAIEITKEAVINDLDKDEEQRAFDYLKKSRANGPIPQALKKLLDEIDAVPIPEESIIQKIRDFGKRVYHSLAKSNLIINLILFSLVVQAGRNVYSILNVLIQRPELSFSEWGQLLSTLLSIGFILLALIKLRLGRREALHLFKFSVLTNILLTQFFIFYHEQLSAVFGLGVNILVLLIINYALFIEGVKAKDKSREIVV